MNTILPFTSEQGVITGFGLIRNGNAPHQFANQLQRGFQRVLSTSDCQWRYPHLTVLAPGAHFCALDDARNQTNICGGDQGGPFALLVRGVWTLASQSNLIHSVKRT